MRVFLAALLMILALATTAWTVDTRTDPVSRRVAKFTPPTPGQEYRVRYVVYAHDLCSGEERVLVGDAGSYEG